MFIAINKNIKSIKKKIKVLLKKMLYQYNNSNNLDYNLLKTEE
ncbi:hypothetical protein DSL72_006803 [Monilinia vaccinii-corymbosi]|uniref:Uncharacterized protein n=1 Tax=Monilinia vaccinii-corymbosi TaxID=61207 RepID=A0A8A3PL72_9HELO|nr:hypothetical protein DSL72_006803 [Monilinia vaccinii-corymbosi]